MCHSSSSTQRIAQQLNPKQALSCCLLVTAIATASCVALELQRCYSNQEAHQMLMITSQACEQGLLIIHLVCHTSGLSTHKERGHAHVP